MREGFYSVHNVVAVDGDPAAEHEEYALAIMAHLKDGRFVGVDPAGCQLVGTYEPRPDGRTLVQVAYTFKAGIELPNGTVFDEPTTIEREVILTPAAFDGEPQMVDFVGFGEQQVRLEWLAEPVM